MNSLSPLTTTSSSFKDTHNRTVVLRGTNLSGSSKLPYGRASHESYHFYEDGETGDLTYIGRPFLLWDRDLVDQDKEEIENDGNTTTRTWYTSRWEDSADCHLARLKGWGFNMLRYLVTWEALEHDGPGKYDYEFIDFTIAVLRKCKQYGFRVYMDPHQDVWSRFSGGSGAPYWTLIACGLNPRNFTQTGTAILHHEYTPPATTQDPNPNPDPAQLPAMLWSTGYNRLAAQTLFTLFFGGRTYAPKSIIDGLNIQDYLQSHFIEAFGVLADKIHDADSHASPEERLLDECIIGWDSMNEPYPGFCAMEKLDWDTTTAHGAALQKGPQPNIMQNLCLGMGIKQSDIENWEFGSFGPKKLGEITIDPRGAKMWITSEEAGEDENGISARWGWRRESSWELGICIWALHGVWSFSDGTPRILNPTYFASPSSSSSSSPDSSSTFLTNFWLPHFKHYASRIRSATSHPTSILFVQPPVFEPPPSIDESILKGRACLSTHYYDGLTLITRHWNWYNADALGVIRGKYRWTWQALKIGSRAIRASLQDQLSILKSDARLISSSSSSESSYPTIIGEIGTPMDMDHKRSYGLPYASPSDGDRFKGDFSEQVKALDASLNALDGDNALNASMWSYAVGNGHRWGDEWNMEDLSLWSRDDVGAEEEKEEDEEEEGTEVNEVKDMEVKDEVDISSRSNLLNNKSLPPLPPPTPITIDATTTTTSIISPLHQSPTDILEQQRDEESSITYPSPPKGRFLHVDTGSVFAVTTTFTTADSSTAASPTAAASPLTMSGTNTPSPSHSPLHSPASATPPNPNPFATTTSLPFARSNSQFKDLEQFNIPLSRGLSRSLPPSPHTNSSSFRLESPRLVGRESAATLNAQTTHHHHHHHHLEQRRTNSTASYLAFLTSGARALKAFCRPYPMASLGTPVNISFDVETGEFKMGVFVPVVSVSPEGENPPPTEIFVPLVHYASTRVLRTMTQRRRKVKGIGSTTMDTTSLRNRHSSPNSPYLQSPHPHMRMMTMDDDDDDNTVPPTPQSMTMHPSPMSISPSAAASASSMTLANILSKPFSSLSTTAVVAGAAAATAAVAAAEAFASSSPILPLVDFDMDLEVKVSHGRAVLKGQVLQWYYDLPMKNEGSVVGEDAESVLYEICVKRGTGSGLRGDGEDEGEEDDGEGWSCPRMCWEALDRCRKGLVG